MKRTQGKDQNKGKKAKAGGVAEDDSGDLTDESYYEHPPAKKETKCATTTTEDLAKSPLKVDAPGKRNGHSIREDDAEEKDPALHHPQFLDLLSHEIYVQVMQTAGAIPKGKAFKTMTEEAARQSIARWYKTAVTKKLQEEKGERSPDGRAQRKLSRRLRKESLGPESEQKRPTGPNAINEGAAQGQDDSLSDCSEDDADKAAKLVAEESGKKAIQMISEDLISRVRMMRAQLTPGVDESDNESSETK